MQKNKKYKQYPARRSGIEGPTTSAKEAPNQPAHTHSYNLKRATQHQAQDRSRSRNHRSRSPKYAVNRCNRADQHEEDRQMTMQSKNKDEEGPHGQTGRNHAISRRR